MSQAIEAIYENGVFRPLMPIDLSEGERVQITVDKKEDWKNDPAANLTDLAVDTGIKDLAVNIDHYLYGLPKQSDDVE
jgi:predicted DNA-binding antitoxin AbrB/MazE fold protein